MIAVLEIPEIAWTEYLGTASTTYPGTVLIRYLVQIDVATSPEIAWREDRETGGQAYLR